MKHLFTKSRIKGYLLILPLLIPFIYGSYLTYVNGWANDLNWYNLITVVSIILLVMLVMAFLTVYIQYIVKLLK